MIGFELNRKAALSGFFDRRAVINATRKADRANLSRFGAFVRRTAKGSIRMTRDYTVHSPPGDPPRAHGDLLRENIFFSYDGNNESVVIGPVKLGGEGMAPFLLEYGGQVNRPAGVISVRPRETQGRRGRRAKGDFVSVPIPAGPRVYEPRPFMRPAFDRTLDQVSNLWKDSVKP